MSIKTATPVKEFQFIVEIDGVDQFELQKVSPPKVEVEVDEHGAGTHRVKTGGMAKVGNAKFEKIKLLSTGTMWAWNWLNRVVNTKTGKGGLAIDYKRTVVIKEMAPDGSYAVSKELWVGVFPVAIERSDKDRKSSNNIIDTIELSVDEVHPM